MYLLKKSDMWKHGNVNELYKREEKKGEKHGRNLTYIGYCATTG
jgi:hypothetical protein